MAASRLYGQTPGPRCNPLVRRRSRRGLRLLRADLPRSPAQQSASRCRIRSRLGGCRLTRRSCSSQRVTRRPKPRRWAKSELTRIQTKCLRSDLSFGMLPLWRKVGATAVRKSAAKIASLREFIAAHPTSSRWKLSRQLCEAWGWNQANGALRDVVSRLASSAPISEIRKRGASGNRL